jgi:hypothetical protein
MRYLLSVTVPALLLTMAGVVAFAQDSAPEPAPAPEVKPEDEAKPADEGKPEGEEKVEEPKQAKIGEKAPDFVLKDANGKEHKLSSYFGKIIVLEWINFDCPYDKKFYTNSGHLPKLQTAYRENDVVWLKICSSGKGRQGHFEGEALLERIRKENVDPGFYLIDADGKVGRLYQARTTPHMFVIDTEGVLRYSGAIDSNRSARAADIEGATNYVSAAIKALKAGEDVNPASTTPYG